MVLCNLQNDYRFFKTLLRRAKSIRISRGVFQDSGCFTVSQKSKHSIRGISSIKITKRFHVGFCPFLLINFIAFMNKLSIKNHDKLFEFIQRNNQKTHIIKSLYHYFPILIILSSFEFYTFRFEEIRMCPGISPDFFTS